jgi:putative transcriptional regulator
MARGEGPENAFIALGYAQWDAGQLERELKDNAWLTLPVSEDVLFDLPYEERWTAAWRSLGVDVATVAPGAGHA